MRKGHRAILLISAAAINLVLLLVISATALSLLLMEEFTWAEAAGQVRDVWGAAVFGPVDPFW